MKFRVWSDERAVAASSEDPALRGRLANAIERRHTALASTSGRKRRTVGLQETRRKEWLLDIEFTKRETFAYSCEAYARIVARAKSPAERRELAVEYGSKKRISAERVDPAEVASIVAEAANARNGWKVILARCAPIARPRSIAQLVRDLNANATTPERA